MPRKLIELELNDEIVCVVFNNQCIMKYISIAWNLTFRLGNKKYEVVTVMQND